MMFLRYRAGIYQGIYQAEDQLSRIYCRRSVVGNLSLKISCQEFVNKFLATDLRLAEQIKLIFENSLILSKVLFT